jgi:hypothetical protein
MIFQKNNLYIKITKMRQKNLSKIKIKFRNYVKLIFKIRKELKIILGIKQIIFLRNSLHKRNKIYICQMRIKKIGLMY